MKSNLGPLDILRSISIGDYLGLPAFLIHVYGHYTKLRSTLGGSDVDTIEEFKPATEEICHLMSDIAYYVPGQWDDSLVAKFHALHTSDSGIATLFAFYCWLKGLPTPPTPEEAGQKIGEIAGQYVPTET